jgi:hypothetical protein
MNEEVLKSYNANNDIFGLPQIYKSISFYPIKVKDQSQQELFYRIFAQPKQYINKKEIIKLTYLKFILYAFGDSENVQNDIISILEHITAKKVKIEANLFDSNKEASIENIIFRIIIDNINFDEQEFDNIREIVLQQNGTSIEYVEDYRPDLEKKMEFFTFGNDVDFVDEIFTFAVAMRLGMAEIGEMTNFQLQNMIERLFVSKNYDMLKPLEVSGQIKLKSGEIKSYLYHMGKKSRYEQLFTPTETWADKNKEILDSSRIKN